MSFLSLFSLYIKAEGRCSKNLAYMWGKRPFEAGGAFTSDLDVLDFFYHATGVDCWSWYDFVGMDV